MKANYASWFFMPCKLKTKYKSPYKKIMVNQVMSFVIL